MVVLQKHVQAVRRLFAQDMLETIELLMVIDNAEEDLGAMRDGSPGELDGCEANGGRPGN